jgi:ABC-type uncharacterized transport system substrate-binding protein
MRRHVATFVLVAMACAGASGSAVAHPHVFADARLEVTVAPDGTVEKIANVWRFDDAFSSEVLVDFDKNGDLKLDAKELDSLSRTILKSTGDYNWFQSVLADGKRVKLAPPARMITEMQDNRLIVLFEIHPEKPLKLQGTVSFGIYDPTFYTAISFPKDTDLVVHGLPKQCTEKVFRPDPDKVLAGNPKMLDEAFFADPKNNDVGALFATRLELTCGGTG